MSSSQDSGLMSSAGLVRYFEEDSSVMIIDPRTLLAFCLVVGGLLQIVTALI